MLKKARPDKLKANFSLGVSCTKLEEANKLLEAGFLDSAMLCAYTSMFHSARAILFNDGVYEKSHYCLIQYLREKYVKTGKLEPKFITIMDANRISRHEVMYGLEPTKLEPQDVHTAIENAKQMAGAIKKLLEGINS